MIRDGQQITCRLSAGGKIKLDIVDRILTDRTAGQYENGWWTSTPEGDCTCTYAAYTSYAGGTGTDIAKYDPECPEHSQQDFFLSETGVLYGHSPNDSSWRHLYQHALGYHVPTMRKSRDFDRMIEAMSPDFSCGTDPDQLTSA